MKSWMSQHWPKSLSLTGQDTIIWDTLLDYIPKLLQASYSLCSSVPQGKTRVTDRTIDWGYSGILAFINFTESKFSVFSYQKGKRILLIWSVFQANWFDLSLEQCNLRI